MNAKWLAHIVVYKDSSLGTAAAQRIIREKSLRQMRLIISHQKDFTAPLLVIGDTKQDLFLAEARIAKTYWREYSKLLPNWCAWIGRTAHGKDIVNKVLDIGYHTLAGILARKFETLDIPTDIGLFHTARSKKAKPLVYDLMECYRVIMVDEVLLRFLRRKKKPIVVDQETIRLFFEKSLRNTERQFLSQEAQGMLATFVLDRLSSA